jgi:hypothetical protein
LRQALREGFFLGVLRKPCDEIGVASGDALFLKCFGHFGNELEQSEAGIDEAVALASLLDKRGNVITGEVEQPLKALCLLIRMHVDSLRIFDLSLVLQKQSMTYTMMGYRTSWNFYL